MSDVIERIKREKLIAFETLANTDDYSNDFLYEKVGNVLDRVISILEESEKEPQINCYLGSPCEYQNKDIEIKEPQECEWIHYNYRTIAPKHHDINNPYWRIPENMDKLKYCPYCGRKIKVIE